MSRKSKRNAGRARQRQSAIAKTNNAAISKAPQVLGNAMVNQFDNNQAVRAGNPYQEQQAGSYRETGLTGLERQHGIIVEEFLPQLKWPRSTGIWREMRDNDPIVGALLFAIEKLMRQVQWRVEKQGDTPEHEEAATFLEECMNDMSMTWGDVISEASSMFPFGWAWLEIVYKVRRGGSSSDGDSSKHNDGRIGWRKMPIRAQETLHRWVFDENGGVVGFIQRPAPTYQEIFIHIEKSLLFRTSTHKNNPEGRSILRNAYRPWYFKKRIEEIEAIGIERDLAGLPLMWVDPKLLDSNATPQEKAVLEEYKKIVTNIRRDKQEGLLLPNVKDQHGNRLFEFELLSAGGTRTFDTDAVITRYERNIAMTVLADWLMLGHEMSGSWALSSDKTSLFSVALGGWLNAMASVFNDYAVPRLFQLNGIDIDPMPVVVHGDIEKPDLAALGTFLTAMANAGIPLLPNDNLVKKLFDAASLPAPTEEDIQNQLNAVQEDEELRQQSVDEEINALTE